MHPPTRVLNHLYNYVVRSTVLPRKANTEQQQDGHNNGTRLGGWAGVGQQRKKNPVCYLCVEHLLRHFRSEAAGLVLVLILQIDFEGYCFRHQPGVRKVMQAIGVLPKASNAPLRESRLHVP